MKSLLARAFGGLVFLLAWIGLMVFLPAGTFAYPAGWIFLANWSLSVIVITVFFLVRSPDLVERRTKVGTAAETRLSQKVIQGFASLFFIANIVVPALDYRFGWSRVPFVVVVLANALVLIGFAGIFWVMYVNRFAASTIEVAEGQPVISAGPYALMRHPMYAGALLMLIATSPALGSWWGLPLAGGIVAVIILRLLDEEKYLAKDLPGYADYCQKVKWRLLPGIW